AAGADAAAEAALAGRPGVAGEVGPHLPQPGERILQLGQFDLEPGLRGAGPGGEDVEDQFAAVEHLDLGGFFQVANLAWRQVVVEDDDIDIGGLDLLLEFFQLALADVGGGVDAVTALRQAADDVGPGGGRQAAEFFQRVAADPGPLRQRDADEESTFLT